jgi:DNA mismatch repair ATPase MutS
VLERARQLLSELAVHHVGRSKVVKHRTKDDLGQLELFVDPMQEIGKELLGLKVDELTPMAAFDLLRKWKEKMGGKSER